VLIHWSQPERRCCVVGDGRPAGWIRSIAGEAGFLFVPFFCPRDGFVLDARNPASRGDIPSPYHARYALVAEKALQLEKSRIRFVAAQPCRRQGARRDPRSDICLGLSHELHRHASLPKLFVLYFYIRLYCATIPVPLRVFHLLFLQFNDMRFSG
jgi:hypothetical protein